MVPRAGESLESANVTGCDDGNGVAARRAVSIATLPGADPDIAVQTEDGAIYTASSATEAEVAAVLAQLREPPDCRLTSAARFRGSLVSVQANEDDQLRSVIADLTSGAGLPFDRYSRITVELTVDPRDVEVAEADVVGAVRSGGPVELTLSCRGSRYHLDTLERVS